MNPADTTTGTLDVGIIGLAGRWPGANDIASFWELLSEGRESMRAFTDDQLRARGVPESHVRDPQFVKMGSVLDDIDGFAAAHFGYSPREAMLMDPQHRVFLECAWDALEDAGYAPRHVEAQVGVFASCSLSSYLLFNILGNARVDQRDESFQAMIGTDKDFLATRVSYKLNLTGPSVTVQTGCSSSLVAICLAVQSLLTYQCDVALAGGVSIAVPQRTGYFFQPGGVASPDGHCRPFAAAAAGTIFGDGAGIVVLKRLAEARADGDQIYAVIKGAATNNDGAVKVGYTAPSVPGQATAIRSALAVANVSAETIGYVEAHGTATALGDPTEVTALTQAFRAETEACGYCALGSVKGNLGHLDAAAGVTGLIKTALMLKHRVLVPSLHWDAPNKDIDFAQTPFIVNTTCRPWEGVGPRRAGVSSFGIGGTNAHVVLEEGPVEAPRELRDGAVKPRSSAIVALSAETRPALDRVTDRLAAHLRAHPDSRLADVAFTLQVGREPGRHRRVVVCDDADSAARTLATNDPERVLTSELAGSDTRRVLFMFPGGASQYPGMGQQLYRIEPVFAAEIDRCATVLSATLHRDLRALLFPSTGDAEAAAHELQRLSLALPAIFATSYAMARLLESWGVRPAGLIGHSLGEYVAACVAGVLSLEDALGIVALRGALVESLPSGAMLSVSATEATLLGLALPDVVVAAVNTPDTCVLSGTPEAIAHAAQVLASRQVESSPLAINVAGHSPVMNSIMGPLRARLQATTLRPPTLPFVSNLTGTWITNDQATDVEYWVEHLRRTVRFSDGLATLGEQPNIVCVEVGPGRSLSSLAKRHPKTSHAPIVATMRHAREQGSEEAALCTAVGRVWMTGVPVDWRAYHAGRDVHRVSLPTYPFERERYWIDPPDPSERRAAKGERLELTDWCHVASWTRAWTPRASELQEEDRLAIWMLFTDAFGVTDALHAQLQRAGASVVSIELGQAFHQIDADRFRVAPTAIEDYVRLLRDAHAADHRQIRIVHAATLTGTTEPVGDHTFAELQDRGLFSLVACARAAAGTGVNTDIAIITNHLEQVDGLDRIISGKATLRAASLVLPQELDSVRCKIVDVGDAWIERGTAEQMAGTVLAECEWQAPEGSIAVRAGFRWKRRYERLSWPEPSRQEWPRPGGVYLLVGGTGQLGLTLARWLGQRGSCRLALTSRSDGTHHEGMATEIAALEALGHEVTLYRANAADADRMQQVIEDIERRCGPIDAVFHLAGLTGAAALRAVSDLAPADCAPHFEAKATGTAVLRRLLRDHPAGVCVTFSSTASVLGGVGMLPYAAANAVLDATAWSDAGDGRTRWLSVNWDGWLTSPGGAGFHSRALDRYAMAASEALEVLTRLLASPVSGQVVVSTGDLSDRIEEWTAPRAASSRDRAREPQARPALQTDYAAPQTELETTLATIWAEVLGVDRVGRHDNLFELGGNSLIALRLVGRITSVTGHAIPVTALFEAPTIQTLARLMNEQPLETQPPAPVEAARAAVSNPQPQAPAPIAAATRVTRVTRAAARETGARDPGAIAIVGMSGRFPGCANVRELWTRLANGEELIRRLDDPRSSGSAVGGRWVRAAAVLDGYELFDAEFFGMTPAEAALRDPQHRLFLEEAWAALEDAGYDCRRDTRPVGVFAGATTNTYLTHHLARRPDVLEAFDAVQINVANGPDFLTTLASYKLNLTGPSHTVQSACSTSLVAVHCACRSLAQRECDMALAGGVSVNVTLLEGYRYVEGGIMSADGHCRAFDARATGTVFGSGVGVVVLKRLEDALADGDAIRAIVRGSAVNNDGALKAGYTTPSVEGQARVIEEALRAAQLDADAISYVECHGTGTTLGDPIEVRALTKAHRLETRGSARRHRCALGSVKTNVGHLDAAAGITSLIKVVQCLAHQQLAPSLHFEQPNPQIAFASTPFYVNTALSPWPAGDTPRRAGVSAFGVGGTNAHVIVEEAPAPPETTVGRSWQLLVWSGKTRDARDAVARQLTRFLRDEPALTLPDVAYTLQVGRQRMAWRGAAVCRSIPDAIAALDSPTPAIDGHSDGDASRLVFVLAGDDDAGVVEAGDDLHQQEPVYAAQIDRCTVLGGSTLFAIESALIGLWASWGVRPVAWVADGVGEYVAACADSALDIEEALDLIANAGNHPSTGSGDARRRPIVPRAQARAHGTVVDVGPAQASLRAMLTTLGRLWVAGVEIDWNGFHANEQRRRVSLPTYPFQRQRYWIDSPAAPAEVAATAAGQPAATRPRVPSSSTGGPAPAPIPVVRGHRPPLRNRYVMPRTEREKLVVAVAESVLGILPIGLTDRFGELGGDSLQAVRLVDALNSRLGCRLQPVDLFENATIRDLLSLLAELDADSGTSERAATQS